MKQFNRKTGRKFLQTTFMMAGLTFFATTSFAKTYTIWVDGLACPFCSYGIEKQLSKLPGVSSVKTSIKSGSVTVNTKNNQTLTSNQMRAAVKRAGFSVSKIK